MDDLKLKSSVLDNIPPDPDGSSMPTIRPEVEALFDFSKLKDISNVDFYKLAQNKHARREMI